MVQKRNKYDNYYNFQLILLKQILKTQTNAYNKNNFITTILP